MLNPGCHKPTMTGDGLHPIHTDDDLGMVYGLGFNIKLKQRGFSVGLPHTFCAKVTLLLWSKGLGNHFEFHLCSCRSCSNLRKSLQRLSCPVSNATISLKGYRESSCPQEQFGSSQQLLDHIHWGEASGELMHRRSKEKVHWDPRRGKIKHAVTSTVPNL